MRALPSWFFCQVSSRCVHLGVDEIRGRNRLCRKPAATVSWSGEKAVDLAGEIVKYQPAPFMGTRIGQA